MHYLNIATGVKLFIHRNSYNVDFVPIREIMQMRQSLNKKNWWYIKSNKQAQHHSSQNIDEVLQSGDA